MTKLVHFDIQPTFSAQGIRSAAKKLDILSLTEEERKAYACYEENTHYEASMHESHYGRGKFDATHGIAKSMLECGVEVAIVMKSTGLAREDVDKIKAGI